MVENRISIKLGWGRNYGQLPLSAFDNSKPGSLNFPDVTVSQQQAVPGLDTKLIERGFPLKIGYQAQNNLAMRG
jgi:hypothetical protein